MVRQEAWRRDLPPADVAQNAELLKLNDVLHLLTSRDRDFALSLQTQHSNRGSLSEKQMFWVRELTKRGNAAQAPAARPLPAAAPAAPSFARINELFAKAGGRAAIVFRTKSGEDFRLSVAGERSQQPGSVNVTDTARGFESRVWFGRITRDGSWQPNRKLDTATVNAVEAALVLFNADPDAASAAFGRETGVCCFCARELTDERSVSVGRGPVCSARFGLPWGGAPSDVAKLTCEEINNADIPF